MKERNILILLSLSKKFIKKAKLRIEKTKPKDGFQKILVCCKKQRDVNKKNKDKIKSVFVNILLFNLNKKMKEIIDKNEEIKFLIKILFEINSIKPR